MADTLTLEDLLARVRERASDLYAKSGNSEYGARRYEPGNDPESHGEASSYGHGTRLKLLVDMLRSMSKGGGDTFWNSPDGPIRSVMSNVPDRSIIEDSIMGQREDEGKKVVRGSEYTPVSSLLRQLREQLEGK